MAVDVLAIMSAAALVALLLRPFRAVTIPGYLIAGALIGPYAFHVVQRPEQSAGVWQFATVLLMFTIGLHLDVGGAGATRGGLIPTLGVGAVSTVLVVLVAWPLALLFGLSAPAALAVAMAVSLSSTAVVLRILEERRELHRTHGRIAFGVLLIQDLLALAMMAAVPMLSKWTQGGKLPLPGASGVTDLTTPLQHIAGIALLIVVGRFVFPRLLQMAAWSGETLLVVSAAMALGAAVATAAMGFSPELGAFLAGFLLAGTPFRYQLAGQLVPLRDLFLAVFFTALGLKLPLRDIAPGWWIVLLGVGGLAIVKTLITGFVAWAWGATAPVAIYAALAMFQGGEFSLVLLAQQAEGGVLNSQQASYAIAIVVLSLMLTPATMGWGRRLAEWFQFIPPAPWLRRSSLRDAPAEENEVAADDAAPHPSLAIIAGFGPVGRAVADTLERQGVRIVIVELNPRTVEKQHGLGRTIVYGDASNREVMERAGVARAEAVILTMPDEESVLRSCRIIRLLHPDIFIAARVNMLSKGLQAMQLGADHTVVEEMATAEAMAKEVMLKLRQRAEGEQGPRLYEVGA